MSDVKNSNSTDKKRKREEDDVETTDTIPTEDTKRKVGKNFESEDKDETIDISKLGKPEENKEETADTSKSEEKKAISDEKSKDVQAKATSLPKFGFVPKQKTEETSESTKENKLEEADKNKPLVAPKFGFVPKTKTEETSESTKENKPEEADKNKPLVTPKFGFVPKTKTEGTSESDKGEPKSEETSEPGKSAEDKGKESVSTTSSSASIFKSTASTWKPITLGFQFNTKSAFSSTIASESSIPKLNVAIKEKVDIPEDIQKQTTGEENEDIIFSGVCILYIFDGENKNWKDKGGKATIHINSRKEDKSKSRILIRNYHSKRILMNSSIFPKMKIMVNENQPNSVRFTAFNEEEVEDPEQKKIEKKIELRVYMLRFKDKSEAEQARKALDECIKNASKDSNQEKTDNDDKKNSETSSSDKKEEEKSNQS